MVVDMRKDLGTMVQLVEPGANRLCEAVKHAREGWDGETTCSESWVRGDSRIRQFGQYVPFWVAARAGMPLDAGFVAGCCSCLAKMP